MIERKKIFKRVLIAVLIVVIVKIAYLFVSVLLDVYLVDSMVEFTENLIVRFSTLPKS